MKTALVLLVVQGAMGAFDTIWYHELNQKIPSRDNGTRELLLHALRDFAYFVIFGSLAWFRWCGLWAALLCGLLLCEIVVTLLDFIEEDRVRPLPPGERTMHTLMAITYGAFLANLLPEVASWWQEPTALAGTEYGLLSYLMSLLAIGVLL